jgi:hypothetical protein
MGLTSTPLLKYSEINTETIDIHDDAWGFSSEFHDVLRLLDLLQPEPADKAAGRLIEAISGRSSV